MKKLSVSELIAFTMLFGFSIFTLLRGMFWIREQTSVLHDSNFYLALHKVMPIWVWGVVIIFSSLLLIGASWLLPRYSTMAYWLLFLGGLATAIVYFFMTSASLFNAINWLTPAQFVVLTAISILLSFVGGAELYDRYKG